MNQQEYYYNSIDKSILSYKYKPFNPSSITINDTPDDIKICYKNRLITNPICMNIGGGSNASFDFENFTPGAGYFTDVNADVTTKQMKLFGRKLTRQQSGEPEEWVKGFIDFSFSCTIAGKSYHLPFHKSLTENLKAALNDVSKVPGFYSTGKIGTYCYRSVNNGNGSSILSNHSYGVAIDINYDLNPFSKGVRAPQTGNTSDPVRWRSFDHPVVKAMARHGFGWGGRYGDYMHFSFFNGG